MLDFLFGSQTPAVNTPHMQEKRVMRMVKNDRMGGYIAKWETIQVENLPPKAQIEQNLAQAQTEKQAQNSGIEKLAYHAENAPSSPTYELQEAFTFGDLVDMANPLQHIPVVGHVYREITGDQIKPISGIIGGAIFAGPTGAALNLMDAVAIAETGKDMADNALDLIFARPLKGSKQSALEDLPGSVIALAELGAPTADHTAHQDTYTAPQKTRDPYAHLNG